MQTPSLQVASNTLLLPVKPARVTYDFSQHSGTLKNSSFEKEQDSLCTVLREISAASQSRFSCSPSWSVVTNHKPGHRIEAVLFFDLHHVEYVLLNCLPKFFKTRTFQRKLCRFTFSWKISRSGNKGHIFTQQKWAHNRVVKPSGPILQLPGLGSEPWTLQ